MTVNPPMFTEAFEALNSSTNSSFAPFGPRVRNSLMSTVLEAAGAPDDKSSGTRMKALASSRRIAAPMWRDVGYPPTGGLPCPRTFVQPDMNGAPTAPVNPRSQDCDPENAPAPQRSMGRSWQHPVMQETSPTQGARLGSPHGMRLRPSGATHVGDAVLQLAGNARLPTHSSHSAHGFRQPSTCVHGLQRDGSPAWARSQLGFPWSSTEPSHTGGAPAMRQHPKQSHPFGVRGPQVARHLSDWVAVAAAQVSPRGSFAFGS